jgi:hypothetical protein
MPHPVIELRITIDGIEALGLFANDMVLAPGDADKPLILAVLAEALSTVCGSRAREIDAKLTVEKPKPKLTIV